MQKPSLLSISTLLVLGAAALSAQTYEVGREATAEEVAAWDVTIGPEGRELPAGSGTAKDGAQVYEVRCKECHGEDGVGGDQAGLVGNPEQLKQAPPIKTVGSYWPYATTLFDYTRRAMPFEDPGTLSADQVYAVTAYVLHLNGLVAEDDVLDR
ncbi:MAG: cytochrome c, partial [Bryobacterales bacterium]|nr:cytochrome c [Bryobacterales bacterium]